MLEASSHTAIVVVATIKTGHTNNNDSQELYNRDTAASVSCIRGAIPWQLELSLGPFALAVYGERRNVLCNHLQRFLRHLDHTRCQTFRGP